MKKLYVRLVLWLIAPAVDDLRRQIEAPRVASEQRALRQIDEGFRWKVRGL